MAFDIGAGLAEAGKSVAQTAQSYTLESQKAELEKEKVLLADQLAGAREDKQRGFITSERVETQKFTGAENEKARANSIAIANIGAEASKASASIHAGATLGAARMNLEASRTEREKDRQFQASENEKSRQFQTGERREERGFQSGEKALDRAADKDKTQALIQSHMDGITKQIAAQYDLQQSSQTFQSGEKEKDRAQQAPLINAEVLQKQVKTASDQAVLDARTDLQKATQAGDPAAIEAAKQKLSIAEYTSKEDMQQVAVYQTQARLIETQLTAAQARLVSLQNNVQTSMTPEGQAAINAMQRQVNKLQSDFDGAISMARQAIGRMSQVGGTTAPTSAPDLSKYMRPPSGTESPSAPPGMINRPTSP